ncbi:hypothetical protein [Nostoc commune]|uniref:hypothetical protein n=1 Tax=Nostoc commune TaxID=1178 RepID=UPI0018C66BF9|nr:hypothetical protein [Nostoc commune]MBG1264243.1 hypothetical protein [Nostoc commune BAE]MBG1264543.1 hypothetical protein [Nostoc commune BAE]MBG1264830.1 hypothetical protein [Nostoc commune BAE]
MSTNWLRQNFFFSLGCLLIATTACSEVKSTSPVTIAIIASPNAIADPQKKVAIADFLFSLSFAEIPNLA